MKCSITLIILYLNSAFAADSNDIWDSCVRKEQCAFFGNMNAQEQKEWVEKYSCQTPLNENFAFDVKGDHIYCPNAIWWVKNDGSILEIQPSQVSPMQNINVNRRNQNSDNQMKSFGYPSESSNQGLRNQPTTPYDRELLLSNNGNKRLPERHPNYYPNGISNVDDGENGADIISRKNYQRPHIANNNLGTVKRQTPLNIDPTFRNNPNTMNKRNTNIGGQCAALTSFPPKPETGCCGREASGSDSITVAPTTPPSRQNAQSKRKPRHDSPPRSQILPSWLTNGVLGFETRMRRDTVNITLDNRIAGGTETELHQFPWTVHLETTFNYGYRQVAFNCGGSLISSRYILTAGHCIYDDGGTVTEVKIYLAEHDKRTFPKDCKIVTGIGQKCVENVVIYAENVILHPQYDDSNLNNDIALIRLRSNAPYTEYIRPICLPSIDIGDLSISNLRLAVTGWGRKGFRQSDVKQSTVVNFVPQQQCKKYYPNLSRRQVCAAGYTGEDTCKGDSGGPLMTVYAGKYVVVGVVSGKRSDSPCGTSVPSLYTNVYVYLNWIRSIIRN